MIAYTNPDRPGVLLDVSNPDAVARWLIDNLFFSRLNGGGPLADNPDLVASGDGPELRVLANANCILYLRSGDSATIVPPPDGMYHFGLAHIALRTEHIDDAIRWCEARQLSLQLADGGSFFNPKVFGNGERFFNIHSPFGVTFEVSERVGHPSPFQENLICGLDHLGIPSPDLDAELAFFMGLGFTPDFATVTNWNATEGTIRCCMLSRAEPGRQLAGSAGLRGEAGEQLAGAAGLRGEAGGPPAGSGITLEIYQFMDLSAVPLPDAYGIRGLVLNLAGARASGVCSPGGVRLLAGGFDT